MTHKFTKFEEKKIGNYCQLLLRKYNGKVDMVQNNKISKLQHQNNT